MHALFLRKLLGIFNKLREQIKEKGNVGCRIPKEKNRKELRKLLEGQLCGTAGTEYTRTGRSRQMESFHEGNF